MKKFFSISFSLLILLSGMHFTIATHYCGGKIAATKISVTGEIASCGMEVPANQCPTNGRQIGSHCCNDKISAFVVDSNYAPSFSVFKTFSLPLLQVFMLPALIQIHFQTFVNQLCTIVRPPGDLMASDVSLPDICVFRI
jgi:hypothetical protein